MPRTKITEAQNTIVGMAEVASFLMKILSFGLFVPEWGVALLRRFRRNNLLLAALRDVAAGPTNAPPSWVTNKNRLQEVFHAMTERKDMPESYVVASFNHADTFQVIMEVAGKLEGLGASFTEQQAAMAHVLLEMWKRLDDDKKRFFAETSLQRKAEH